MTYYDNLILCLSFLVLTAHFLVQMTTQETAIEYNLWDSAFLPSDWLYSYMVTWCKKVTLGAKLIIPEETMVGLHTLNFISC